jgi:predicted metalloprotease
MIPTEVIMGTGVALGMLAGYWRGRVDGRKRERQTIQHMTMVTIQSTSALANGAVDVLKDKLKIDRVEASKMLMEAAGQYGFMGAMLDGKTGEMIHAHNPPQQK